MSNAKDRDHKDRDIVRRKLVIVGDGACGKTSLLSVFTLGYFPKVRRNGRMVELLFRVPALCVRTPSLLHAVLQAFPYLP